MPPTNRRARFHTLTCSMAPSFLMQAGCASTAPAPAQAAASALQTCAAPPVRRRQHCVAASVRNSNSSRNRRIEREQRHVEFSVTMHLDRATSRTSAQTPLPS